MRHQSAPVRARSEDPVRGLRLPGLWRTRAANPCELTRLPASVGELTGMWVAMEESCAENHLLFEGAGYPFKSAWQLPSSQWRPLWSCLPTGAGGPAAALCWGGSGTKAGEGHGFWGLSWGTLPPPPPYSMPHAVPSNYVTAAPWSWPLWAPEAFRLLGPPAGLNSWFLAASPTLLIQIMMLICVVSFCPVPFIHLSILSFC